jgi:hypothetical protein
MIEGSPVLAEAALAGQGETETRRHKRYAGPRGSLCCNRLMKSPFTDADLSIWDLSIIHSPWRWRQCAHGHEIDLWGNSLVSVQKKLSGWYIRHDCWKPCTSSQCLGPYVPSTSDSIPVPCKGYIDLKVPDKPTEHLWAPYPQHTSTQWRDSADLLPRTDGIYTSTISNNKEIFKPRVILDRCLAFTPEGDVFDFEVRHDGYEKETFQERAGRIVPWFRADRLSFGPGMAWRGLYEVSGISLTCSLTEIKAAPYTFAGNLQGDATTLKLKWVGQKGKAKFEYEFRPLAVQPGSRPTPAVGQAKDAPRSQPQQQISAARLFELLSESAAQVPYANRPIKSSIKAFANARYIQSAERIIGICDLHFTYMSTFLFVVTSERIYLSSGSIGNKYWKDLAVQIPSVFNVDDKTFCIPLTRVEECSIKDGSFCLKIAEAPVVEFSAYDAKTYASLIQRFMWAARNNS